MVRPVTVVLGTGVLLALMTGACTATSPVAISDAAASPASAPLPGGYFAQDPQDESIKAAAAKAVALLRERQQDPAITLSRIVSAETQVVAGLNYRLRLDLQTAQGAKTVVVTLYRDLQEHYSLTKVEGL